MSAKKTPCSDCGCMPEILGSDYLNDHGPWEVRCPGCGKETLAWNYQRDAWKQWVADNRS